MYTVLTAVSEGTGKKEKTHHLTDGIPSKSTSLPVPSILPLAVDLLFLTYFNFIQTQSKYRKPASADIISQRLVTIFTFYFKFYSRQIQYPNHCFFAASPQKRWLGQKSHFEKELHILRFHW